MTIHEDCKKEGRCIMLKKYLKAMPDNEIDVLVYKILTIDLKVMKRLL